MIVIETEGEGVAVAVGGVVTGWRNLHPCAMFAPLKPYPLPLSLSTLIRPRLHSPGAPKTSVETDGQNIRTSLSLQLRGRKGLWEVFVYEPEREGKKEGGGRLASLSVGYFHYRQISLYRISLSQIFHLSTNNLQFMSVFKVQDSVFQGF